MTTLTASSTIAIGDGPTVSASTSLVVLPLAGTNQGPGRLVHPTFGAYDYARPPDEWMNMDGDAMIPPVWASTKTLSGAANTLFPGTLGRRERRWHILNRKCRISGGNAS